MLLLPHKHTSSQLEAGRTQVPHCGWSRRSRNTAAQTVCSRSASGRPKKPPVPPLLGHTPMKTAMVAADECSSFAKEPGRRDAGVGEGSGILTRSLVPKDLLRGVTFPVGNSSTLHSNTETVFAELFCLKSNHIQACDTSKALPGPSAGPWHPQTHLCAVAA